MIRASWFACLLLMVSWQAIAGVPPPVNINQGTSFDQRIGAQVPMELPFLDTDGSATTLGRMTQGKPFILALGYFHCPNLCGVVLHAMAASVANMSLRVGSDYQVVFVSIDPQETPADAIQTAHMLERMNPSAQIMQWHFLTGPVSSIRGLANAVGFHYFYDPRIRQYAHATGVVALTGQGKVAQYFFGVNYPPQSLRLALIGASQGHLGNVIDQLVLACCGYDPSTGHYNLLIGRMMRVLGIAFVVGMLLVLVWFGSRRSMQR